MTDLGTLGEEDSAAWPVVSIIMVKSLEFIYNPRYNLWPGSCLFILRGHDDGPGHPGGDK